MTYLLCGWILGLMFGWFGHVLYDKYRGAERMTQDREDGEE